MGGGADGPQRRDLHAVRRDRGAHAVQSGDRRHGEGTPGPRDRRARRADGARDRRDRDPVQAAEPQPRTGGLVAARPGGQAPLQRSGCSDALGRSRASPGSSAAPVGSSSRRRRCRRARARERRDYSLPRAGRHDRHVPQRTRARRPRSATVGARRRTAVARSRGVDQVDRLRVGAAEDRHAAAPRSQRASTSRGSPWNVATIRRCRSRFSTGGIERPQIDCHLLHTTERVHELVREHIGESPLFNGQITGIGPRYCPSLEDKVMRFPHRERHQIVPRARRCRRRRDLRQRLLDEPAGGRSDASSSTRFRAWRRR